MRQRNEVEEIELSEDEESALDAAWDKLSDQPDDEEKFQHHEMKPSPFKGRKFVPPKEKA